MSRFPPGTPGAGAVGLRDTTYGNSYGAFSQRYDKPHQVERLEIPESPRIVAVRGPSRLEVLEDRLNVQERTTHSLLDRAMKIKEDIIESLNFSQGSWQEEKYARELLSEHIKSIMAVVKRLSKDIEMLDSDIKNKDTIHHGTNNSVKNLEMHHVAGLTDIRGRIARCDQFIAKLSSDLKGCFDNVKTVSRDNGDMYSKLMDRVQGIDRSIGEINSRLEKTNMEQTMKLTTSEGNYKQNLAMLDSKTQAVIEDLRRMILGNREYFRSELHTMETNIANLIERSDALQSARMDKFEHKVNEDTKSLQIQLVKQEEELLRQNDRITAAQAEFERRMTNELQKNMERNKHDIDKLKHECREGFGTVHESISNMKTVMDGKRRLLEEQLKREIGQVRKMVVMI